MSDKAALWAKWWASLTAEDRYDFDSEGRGYKKDSGRMMHLAFDAGVDSQAAQIAALTAERDVWIGLYRRAINEANGLTNYVEDRPELYSAEKRLSAIEDAARASLNPTSAKEVP